MVVPGQPPHVREYNASLDELTISGSILYLLTAEGRGIGATVHDKDAISPESHYLPLWENLYVVMSYT